LNSPRIAQIDPSAVDFAMDDFADVVGIDQRNLREHQNAMTHPDSGSATS
jgi:hypothetical protein